MANGRLRSRVTGFALLEVLITIVILLFGLLGLAGLNARAQTAELESYQRTQALILVQDMVNRISANRKTAACYAFTTVSGIHAGHGAAAPSCMGGTGTAAMTDRADRDLSEWHDLLGNSTASTVGALIGARGCVTYNAASEVLSPTGGTLAGTGLYTVSVAWQGMTKTAAPSPAFDCGENQYGTELQRRVVSALVRIASLM